MQLESSSIRQIQKAKENFAKLQKNLEKPGNAMYQIAGIAYRDVIQHFTDQTGPKRKWQKWSRRNPKTGRREFFSSRPYGKGGNKLLMDKGTLRTSIQFQARTNIAKVYTDLHYAKYHEYGTKRMVARRFMWLSKAKRAQIVNKFRRSIIGT